jgi:D-alanyl-lipoteichoic acid acyltransferase DltB (MBOAT superfamily)
MLLSGLWHGASWTFVCWGAYHAVMLHIERLTKWPHRLQVFKSGNAFSFIITMLQVCIGWVLFRADTIQQAFQIFRNLFSFRSDGFMLQNYHYILLLLCIIAELPWKNVRLPSQKQHTRLAWETAFVICLFTASIFLRGKGNQFIYFQF